MSIDREVCKVVQERFSELGHDQVVPESLEFLKVQGKLSKNASIIGLVIDSSLQQPVAVAKIPRNPECTIAIEQELTAMESMRESASKWPGSVNVPYQGFIETILGSKVLIQSAKQGYSLVRDMVGQQDVQQVYSRVIPWMIDFHKTSAKEVQLEGDVLHKLVVNPVEQFITKINALENIELPESVNNYFNSLADDVVGSTVKLCHKHGDFNAHNILVTDASKHDAIYIIDWEDYQADQLPIHDLNHFFISNSKLLDMSCTSEQAFEKYLLNDGWYRDAYINAIKNYETEGFITVDNFHKLTPLYMAEICLSLMSEQRQQENTINVWVSRMDRFISVFKP